MKKYFDNGDLFAYEINKLPEYGMIQVISKTNLGYTIRVFEKTQTDLSVRNIDNLTASREFYYIREFSLSELMKGTYLGHFNIPDFVKIPKLFRSSERKLNGKLYWHVIDAKSERVMKSYEKFDSSLTPLSPGGMWGIEYIKLRWLEGFTLEKWNDDLEDKWYMNYLRLYEPEKLSFPKKEFLQIAKPTSSWNIENKEIIKQIDSLLDTFLKSLLEMNDQVGADEVVKSLVQELNALNAKYDCIETQEREELLEYISDILLFTDNENLFEMIDTMRNW